MRTRAIKRMQYWITLRQSGYSPITADAYYGRGNAYSRLSEYDHAIQDYDKVVELDPKFLLAYEGRGCYLLQHWQIYTSYQ